MKLSDYDGLLCCDQQWLIDYLRPLTEWSCYWLSAQWKPIGLILTGLSQIFHDCRHHIRGRVDHAIICCAITKS